MLLYSRWYCTSQTTQRDKLIHQRLCTLWLHLVFLGNRLHQLLVSFPSEEASTSRLHLPWLIPNCRSSHCSCTWCRPQRTEPQSLSAPTDAHRRFPRLWCALSYSCTDTQTHIYIQTVSWTDLLSFPTVPQSLPERSYGSMDSTGGV